MLFTYQPFVCYCSRRRERRIILTEMSQAGFALRAGKRWVLCPSRSLQHPVSSSRRSAILGYAYRDTKTCLFNDHWKKAGFVSLRLISFQRSRPLVAYSAIRIVVSNLYFFAVSVIFIFVPQGYRSIRRITHFFGHIAICVILILFPQAY